MQIFLRDIIHKLCIMSHIALFLETEKIIYWVKKFCQEGSGRFLIV